MSPFELTLYDGYSQEIPKEEPGKLQRLFFNIDFIRVRGVADTLQRTEEDAYKSDREMSVCEMQEQVSEAALDYALESCEALAEKVQPEMLVDALVQLTLRDERESFKIDVQQAMTRLNRMALLLRLGGVLVVSGVLGAIAWAVLTGAQLVGTGNVAKRIDVAATWCHWPSFAVAAGPSAVT